MHKSGHIGLHFGLFNNRPDCSIRKSSLGHLFPVFRQGTGQEGGEMGGGGSRGRYQIGRAGTMQLLETIAKLRLSL